MTGTEEIPDDLLREAINAKIQVDAVVDAIKPLLHGRGPTIQGLVLSELVAIFLGGFVEEGARESMTQLHIDTVRSFLRADAAATRDEVEQWH